MITNIEDIRELLVDMGLGGATLNEMNRVCNYSIKLFDLKNSYHSLGIEELVQKYDKEKQ